MTESKRFRYAVVAVLVLSGAAIWAAMALQQPAVVVYDQYRIPNIRAKSEGDAMYMLGYMHAKDRFFQMDFQRRAAQGTLAELLGSAALPTDVQLRTLGIGRAAAASLPIQTDETLEWLERYSDGVNAWLNDELVGTPEDELCDDDISQWDDANERVARLFNPLPIEYSALQLDRSSIPEWTPLDSLAVAKLLAFELSFGLEDIDNTIALQTYIAVFGQLNGLRLWGSDLLPIQPFDPSTTIPLPLPPGGGGGGGGGGGAPPNLDPGPLADPNLVNLLSSYREQIQEIPLLKKALERDFTQQGSNWFIASGANTVSGNTLFANDPHLALDQPATFYEAHVQVEGGINVAGISFPGVPGLVQGCNDTICWGSTVNALDVTDVYQEVLVATGSLGPGVPSHIFRVDGPLEPLIPIPQSFKVNITSNGLPNTIVDSGITPADPGGLTLVVPRRNNGPIVQVIVNPSSPTPLTGLSVAYTGWGATQELEAFRLFARAESVDDFKEALQFFDVGSQNWGYADIYGNIAYFTSAEAPIREDLQLGFFPDGGRPPYGIRDGSHTLKHDWLPVQNPQPGQALTDFEILPFDEMPQLVNPPSGILLNANNDPMGNTINNTVFDDFRVGFNGLLYLSPIYAPGFRQGRIQRLFDEALASGPLTKQQFIEFQANNQLLDAEYFTPYIVDAFANASAGGAAANLAALAADPEIAEAVGRLAAWDYSTPTGIPEGFDPFDTVVGQIPTQAEIDASVAATIYSVWRGQLVQRVIDGTMNGIVPGLPLPGSSQAVVAVRRLLDRYDISGGVGQSGINFFFEPDGADKFDRRDLIMLRAVRSALDLLASPEFDAAFAGSTTQDDYRWGKLHRIVLDSQLAAAPGGGVFSIPPQPVGPGNLAPDLPGFSRAGGFGAVDASSHSARSDGLNEFMFGSGPSRRVVAEMTPTGPDVLEVIPGGQSGALGSPHATDQLNLWLVNAYHPLPISTEDVFANAVSCQLAVSPDELDDERGDLEQPDRFLWYIQDKDSNLIDGGQGGPIHIQYRP